MVQEQLRQIQYRYRYEPLPLEVSPKVSELENEIAERRELLQQKTYRVLWQAYQSRGEKYLQKELFQMKREERRTKRAEHRQLLLSWWRTKSIYAANQYAMGMSWLVKERPEVLVKTLSCRPLRFNEFERLKPREPYDLVEIKYRSGMRSRIIDLCMLPGDIRDESKFEILSRMGGTKMCIMEALPLKLLEQLEDILGGYAEVSPDFDKEEMRHIAVFNLEDSDHEFEDGRSEDLVFWYDIEHSNSDDD